MTTQTATVRVPVGTDGDPIGPDAGQLPTFDWMLMQVCHVANLRADDVLGPKLLRRHATARGVLALMAYELLGMSYAELAEALCRANGDTVHRLCRSVERRLEAQEPHACQLWHLAAQRMATHPGAARRWKAGPA